MRITKKDKLEIIHSIIRSAYDSRFTNEQHSEAGLADFIDDASGKLLNRFGLARGLSRPSKEEIEEREREWDLKEKKERISARVFDLIKTIAPGESSLTMGDLETDIKGLIRICSTIDDQVERLIK